MVRWRLVWRRVRQFRLDGEHCLFLHRIRPKGAGHSAVDLFCQDDDCGGDDLAAASTSQPPFWHDVVDWRPCIHDPNSLVYNFTLCE